MKQAPNMEIKRELAERIKLIRTQAQLSQAAFATSIEVSRVHLSHMESPDFVMMPSKPVLKKICDTYNVNFGWLMTGEGDTYKKDSEENFIHNENITTVTSALIEQTLEYVSLKSSSLLKAASMNEKRFSRYFYLFITLINLVFRLMDEMKEYYISKTDIPEEFYDKYIEEFRKALKD